MYDLPQSNKEMNAFPISLKAFTLLFAKDRIDTEEDLILHMTEADNLEQAVISATYEYPQLAGGQYTLLKHGIIETRAVRHIPTPVAQAVTPDTVELLPPKQNFLYYIELLQDRANATKAERKVIRGVVDRFKASTPVLK